MAAVPSSLGTITLELHLVTKFGGPIVLAEGEIDVPVSAEATGDGATLRVDTGLLHHEIANALIEAARQIDRD